MTKDAQMGDIRSSIFSSSTCVTVQSLHEHSGTVDSLSDGADTIAALSKNLENIFLEQGTIALFQVYIFQATCMFLQLFPTNVLETNFMICIVLVGVMVQNKTMLT